jgi:NAD(P)-dependent dehydrogenase (short-subunit alcohol dehydrogenase family)
MPDHGGVWEELVQTLREWGVQPLLLENPSDIDIVVSQLDAWMAEGPVVGAYWLPALDIEPALRDLDLAGWKEGLRVRVKLLAATMRALYGQVGGPGSFLVSATRMGGRHGYDAGGATAPMGGAVTGFTKAYKREQPDCLVKAVDVESNATAKQVAAALLEETRRDPGAVEIGRQGRLRWSIGLQEQSATDGKPGLPLGPDTVFVVTGAAGSIVSAIISDLAAASGGTFHLLDLVPEPDADNPELERFVTDRDGLKRDLFQRIKDRGERATPVLVERELAKLERARAALDAMASVRRAGGRVVYHRADLRDVAAVTAAIDDVRRHDGRVDVLVHAAGLEISKSLHDKPDSEFDLVFDVKSDGWFNLLAAIGDMPLGATVCFSSVAGRFGNAGQTDYSAANDLLCKTTSSFRTSRPDTRGIVADWTAWGGIGMATRGSIPKVMELAGIDMLSPEAGIPWIRRELVAGAGRGEVLVGSRLGVLTEEVDPDDGLDRSAVAALTTGPMLDNILAMGVWRPMTVKTMLDPTVQGFLDDHRIDGTAVLPGAMGVEAFAEVALVACPGWTISAVEEVAFLAPFKFYRDQPREVTIEATLSPGDAGEVIADCRLIGSRALPNQPAPQVTTHFTGRVRLVPAASPREASLPGAVSIPADGVAVGHDAIYRVYFHGPTYQVLDCSWRQGDSQVGMMASGLPPNHLPADLPLAVAPRLLELCFQTAGVWELGTSGRMALPRQVARVVATGSEQDVSGRVYATVTPRPDGEGFDAKVVDETGRVHLIMLGYQTVQLQVPVDAGLARSLQTAVR